MRTLSQLEEHIYFDRESGVSSSVLLFTTFNVKAIFKRKNLFLVLLKICQKLKVSKNVVLTTTYSNTNATFKLKIKTNF